MRIFLNFVKKYLPFFKNKKKGDTIIFAKSVVIINASDEANANFNSRFHK